MQIFLCNFVGDMISVDHLCVEFSARALFEDASFVINARDRIALVGKNGAGKSTLLKVLCGKQLPSSGVVNVPSDCRVGYLPQVMNLDDDCSVRDEAMKAFDAVSADVWDIDYGEEARRVGLLERTLKGLGFSQSDLDRPTSEFSGGWRMRIELAKLLLQSPDVLLLDEPTNHLDIESIRWLETWLLREGAAVVLVSHDRAFINNVTNHTLEISCRRVIDYKARYDEYLVLREERREQQLRAYENQQKEIADAREFINRFRYQATKAVQVQQKLRQLEKLVPIEVDEVDRSALRLRFPSCLRSGDFPLVCEDVGKVYGEKRVFGDVNLSLRRGDKVAFVGKNGEGKSTLVKIIMEGLEHEGVARLGHNVQMGYFAQNQAQLLNGELTVFETIDRVARGEIRLRINDILGAFMFGGEASEKKVKVLSGGERTRLAMIKLLLEPVNFLILDEPTNHLDLQSKDVLKEALRAFKGTAIIVSHDRHFLDGLVDRVYGFGEGKVREFMGGIYEYLETSAKQDGPTKQETVSKQDSPAAQATPPKQSATTEQVLSYAERKAENKRLAKRARQISECEARMTSLQQKLNELDALLCLPENASNLAMVNDYTLVRAELDDVEMKWLELNE